MNTYRKSDSSGPGNKYGKLVDSFIKEAQTILDTIKKEHDHCVSDKNVVIAQLHRLAGLSEVIKERLTTPYNYLKVMKRISIEDDEPTNRNLGTLKVANDEATDAEVPVDDKEELARAVRHRRQ